jgi:hypothetical protein
VTEIIFDGVAKEFCGKLVDLALSLYDILAVNERIVREFALRGRRKNTHTARHQLLDSPSNDGSDAAAFRSALSFLSEVWTRKKLLLACRISLLFDEAAIASAHRQVSPRLPRKTR